MDRRLLPALLLPLPLLLSACHGGAAAVGQAGGGKDAGTDGKDAGTDGKGSVSLNVGDQKGNSEAVMRAAGELKRLPYRIKWSTFSSGPPLLEAVNAGAVDVGGVGNTPPVFAGAAGSRIKVVGASRASTAGQDIVVRKGSPLRRTADLRGKTVAVAQGSSAHWQLITALAKAGLGIKDVHVSYLQPADALAAFSRGRVDAWAIWDPYTSQALDTADARVLSGGKGTANGLSFEVASDSALAKSSKSAALRDYLDRLRRAQDWAHRHPETWAKAWAQDTGLPLRVARDAVRRTRGTTVTVAADGAAAASEQRIVDRFADLKLIPRRFDFAGLLDTRFNKGLPPSTTAPLPTGG